MSAIEKLFGYAELKDGTTWEGVRITFATKVAFERSARANGWDAEKQPFTVSAFWSWHAAKLAGLTTLSWKEFNDQVVDAGATQDEPEDSDDAPSDDADAGAGGEVVGERPTQEAASTDTPWPSPSDPASPSITG